MLADMAGQQVDDLELTDRELDIDLVPEGSADMRLEHEPAELKDLVPARLRHLDAGDDPKPIGQDGNAPRLVDEVDGAMLESKTLVAGERPVRQEHDREIDALAPQLLHQLEAGTAGKPPIQNDEIRSGQRAAGSENGRRIREGRHGKSPLGQFIRQHLAEVIIAADGDDPDLGRWIAAHQERRYPTNRFDRVDCL